MQEADQERTSGTVKKYCRKIQKSTEGMLSHAKLGSAVFFCQQFLDRNVAGEPVTHFMRELDKRRVRPNDRWSKRCVERDFF